MSSSPLRIAVTGLAATYPFGGVFWDYIQYVLGFLDLGHDVLYIEDTGRWCYDPVAATFVEGGERNARYLSEQLAALDPRLTERWFFRDAAGATYGRPWNDVVRFCDGADMFLHISASCWMREEYRAARCLAFIDSDPMYTQASIPDYVAGTISDDARSRVEMLREHDVHFTFAENMGAADCRVPDDLFSWIPTRQPIVHRCFEQATVPVAARERKLTTVASWEPTEAGPVIRGVKYTGKSTEFERFLDLPRHSPLPLELALSGNVPVDRLRARGWQVRDGLEVSRDPWTYRDYLARSLGEWSVAKNAYVASRSGWFSCRTACYLALGVPAVVQQTAFQHAIPTGDGLLAFETLDEAALAIEQLAMQSERHVKAATEIAREYFDSVKVLTALLEAASAAPSSASAKESLCES